MTNARRTLRNYERSLTVSNQPQATATASSGGIGLFGLTFVALLVLKLTGLADISWLIVFLPLIIGFGLVVLFLLVGLIFALIIAIKD